MEPKTELIFEDTTVSREKSFNIIHFNDVYNVETAPNGIGGASRFITLIEHIKSQKPTLVLFSGDAFSPSTISMILKGKQMAEILNSCQVDVACVGNHDFDFGIQTLEDLLQVTNFPWLLSNVVDAYSLDQLAGTLKKQIIEFEGIKIGIIGLVEEDWMATLSTVDFDEIKYASFILAGKRLANQLKSRDKVDYVIALTHMRVPNDELLLNSVPEIDLFLGGHDHDYYVKQINNKWLIKSGTDFRELTLIEINIDEKIDVSKVEKFIVDSTIPEKLEIKEIVNVYLEELNALLDISLGEIHVDLDGRFSSIRSQETNLGDFICDIVLEAVNADGFVINSGSFRSDQIHPKGEFKIKDLKAILPYTMGILMFEMSGEQLYATLENGVSQYPKLEGRFLQISGISFEFDPSKPSGEQINPTSVKVQDEPLELHKTYRIATIDYLADGKDGFNVFKSCRVLADEEYFPSLFTIVENHFKAVKLVRENSNARYSRLHQSLCPLVIVDKLVRQISHQPSIFKEDLIQDKRLTFYTVALMISKTLRLQRETRQKRRMIKRTQEFRNKVASYEEKAKELAPQIDGRIKCLS